MLRILITNDDGIDALGIRKLTEALLTLPDVEVFVVAPSEEKSGVGHGVTYREALAPKEHSFYGLPVKAWAVNGNPADCVKAAYFLLMNEGNRPDLVFSGVNVGNNLGKDVYYSGTCSAAREAVILGIPAVALSYDNYFHPDDYGQVEELIAPILASFVEKARRNQMEKEVFWNINIPHLKPEEVKGVAPAVLSLYHYQDKYTQQEQGFWLTREYKETKEHEDAEDYRLLCNGFITITPVHIDSTDRALLQELEEWALVKDWKYKGTPS